MHQIFIKDEKSDKNELGFAAETLLSIHPLDNKLIILDLKDCSTISYGPNAFPERHRNKITLGVNSINIDGKIFVNSIDILEKINLLQIENKKIYERLEKIEIDFINSQSENTTVDQRLRKRKRKI